MIIIVKLYWVFTIFRILFIHEFVPLIFIRPYEITVLFPLYRRGKWRHRELSNLFRQEWVDPGPPRWSWASPWVVGAQISWLTLGSEWSDVWHWGTGALGTTPESPVQRPRSTPELLAVNSLVENHPGDAWHQKWTRALPVREDGVLSL